LYFKTILPAEHVPGGRKNISFGRIYKAEAFMDIFIFIIAVLNSVLLTAVFLAQIKGKTALVRVLGVAFLCLAFPGAAALIMAFLSGAAIETVVFLCIFLVYLIVEWLYDYALKLDFRGNWRLLVPYLALYFASNYGFFVMSYRISPAQGFIILALAAVQIAANLLTHTKKK
jgi:hypothetical protein